jgi:hypothetical protein
LALWLTLLVIVLPVPLFRWLLRKVSHEGGDFPKLLDGNLPAICDLKADVAVVYGSVNRFERTSVAPAPVSEVRRVCRAKSVASATSVPGEDRPLWTGPLCRSPRARRA